MKTLSLYLVCWERNDWHFEEVSDATPQPGSFRVLFWEHSSFNKICLMIWIWFTFEILFCDLKAFDFFKILRYLREVNIRWFDRPFWALVMSEKDCLTAASTVLFKAVVVIAACFASFVMNMEIHYFDFKALWQSAERIPSIFLIKLLKYNCLEVFEKVRIG